MDRVDLDEVAGHNTQAVEKLAKVADALSELSAGRNVEYIAGVDEAEAPVMDTDQLRRSQLMTALSEAGLAERLGRVYMQGQDNALTAIDLIPHRDGLPAFEVCLAPVTNGGFCAADPAMISVRCWLSLSAS